MTALSELVDGSRQNLDALLGDLTVVLDATDRQQQAVHEALILIGPTFENVGEVGGQGPWLDFLLYSFMGNDA